MKRIVLALLGLAVLFSAIGCGSDPNQNTMVDSQKKLEDLDKKDGNVRGDGEG